MAVFLIPALAIHLDWQGNFALNQVTPVAGFITAELNRPGDVHPSETDKNADFSPFKSVTERHHSYFIELTTAETDVKPAGIMDFEIILFDTHKACFGGLLEEFISPPRLNNLSSNFCATVGLSDFVADKSAFDDEDAIRLIALFDTKESAAVQHRARTSTSSVDHSPSVRSSIIIFQQHQPFYCLGAQTLST